jgi:hypothetical protein
MSTSLYIALMLQRSAFASLCLIEQILIHRGEGGLKKREATKERMNNDSKEKDIC